MKEKGRNRTTTSIVWFIVLIMGLYFNLPMASTSFAGGVVPVKNHFANSPTQAFKFRGVGRVSPPASDVLADDCGDTADEATSVKPNSRTSGLFHVLGDVDYYKIVLPADGVLTVFTEGNTDTKGRMEDEYYEIAEDDNNGENGNFSITKALDAGVYYVQVTGRDHQRGANYELICRFMESIRTDDHGDSIEDASTVKPNSINSGTLHNSKDVDYFRISIPVHGTLKSFTRRGNTWVALEDAHGNFMSDGSLSGTWIRVSQEVSPGEYYLAVSRGDPDAEIAACLVVPYTLFCRFTPSSAPNPYIHLADALTLMVESLILTQTQSGNLEPAREKIEAARDRVNSFYAEMSKYEALFDADGLIMDFDADLDELINGTVGVEDFFSIWGELSGLQSDSGNELGSNSFDSLWGQVTNYDSLLDSMSGSKDTGDNLLIDLFEGTFGNFSNWTNSAGNSDESKSFDSPFVQGTDKANDQSGPPSFEDLVSNEGTNLSNPYRGVGGRSSMFPGYSGSTPSHNTASRADFQQNGPTSKTDLYSANGKRRGRRVAKGRGVGTKWWVKNFRSRGSTTGQASVITVKKDPNYLPLIPLVPSSGNSGSSTNSESSLFGSVIEWIKNLFGGSSNSGSASGSSSGSSGNDSPGTDDGDGDDDDDDGDDEGGGSDDDDADDEGGGSKDDDGGDEGGDSESDDDSTPHPDDSGGYNPPVKNEIPMPNQAYRSFNPNTPLDYRQSLINPGDPEGAASSGHRGPKRKATGNRLDREINWGSDGGNNSGGTQEDVPRWTTENPTNHTQPAPVDPPRGDNAVENTARNAGPSTGHSASATNAVRDMSGGWLQF